MKRYVIGNWKMNLALPEALILAQSVATFSPEFPTLRIIIAPSLPWIVPIKEAISFAPNNFALASQVVSQYPEGAYTGDVSAEQLKPFVTYCLVGHSERRRFHHEESKALQHQIKELLRVGITPVLCFGEAKQSNSPALLQVLIHHLNHDLGLLERELIDQCLLAYEPLWAIGTGTPARPSTITKTIQAVKDWLQTEKGIDSIPILYGGSVTQDNAASLGKIKICDGLLVGGASLHAREFHTICAKFAGAI